MKGPTFDLSQQIEEAGSSPILEVQERAGAAPTTKVQIGTTRRSETGKQDGKV